MMTKNGQNLASDDEYNKEESAPSSHRTATKPNNTVTTIGNCTLDTKDIVINKTFDISNCTEQQIKELRLACLKNNSIIVLRTGNKIVAEHQVTANINSTSFTCQEARWFTITDSYGKVAPVDRWTSETNPSYTSCATTCNKIQTYTKIVDQDNDEIEGREFPDNKQCVAACAPHVKDACNGLLGKPWGNRTIRQTEAFYRMDKNNILRYGCKYM